MTQGIFTQLLRHNHKEERKGDSKMNRILPSRPPRSSLGYPASQLREMLDEQEYRRLMVWMRGQTVGVENNEAVVYSHDLIRWMNAGKIVD